MMHTKIFKIVLPEHLENIKKKIRKSYKRSEKADNLARKANSWIQYGLSFEYPFIFKGSSFEKKVYSHVTKIPKGKVASYKQVAEALNSKAYRAVGNAMKKNDVPLLIPCHRVVRTDGKLGNYSGGTDLKERILYKEGVELENGIIPPKYFVESL
ncbi:MAG: MGMT family protein [Euryarchaeota archaeon]|nr:MGMT family protein [Euryarchaeota archaeon]